MVDEDTPYFIYFIYDYLTRYKQYFDKSNADRAKQVGNVSAKIKSIPEKTLLGIKQKIDTILDGYKNKRIPEIKDKYKSQYIKKVQSDYNEKEIKRSFTNLLNNTKYINENIVADIVDNSLRGEDDMKYILYLDKITEAETGFTPQLNALSIGEKIFDYVYKFYDKTFGKKWKDLKFKVKEVVEGYFTKLYNKNAKIKEPTIRDLRQFRDDLLDRINKICNYIEKVLAEEIENTKKGFTTDNINTFLTVDLKDQGITPDDNNSNQQNTSNDDGDILEPDAEEVDSEEQNNSDFQQTFDTDTYKPKSIGMSEPENGTTSSQPEPPKNEPGKKQKIAKEIFYLSVPNSDGSFNVSSIKKNYEEGTSFYKFFKMGDKFAEFKIELIGRSFQTALQYPEKTIDIACEAQNAYNPNAKEVRTIVFGSAELQNDKWVITKKAKINYL